MSLPEWTSKSSAWEGETHCTHGVGWTINLNLHWLIQLPTRWQICNRSVRRRRAVPPPPASASHASHSLGLSSTWFNATRRIPPTRRSSSGPPHRGFSHGAPPCCQSASPSVPDQCLRIASLSPQTSRCYAIRQADKYAVLLETRMWIGVGQVCSQCYTKLQFDGEEKQEDGLQLDTKHFQCSWSHCSCWLHKKARIMMNGGPFLDVWWGCSTMIWPNYCFCCGTEIVRVQNHNISVCRLKALQKNSRC